MIRLQRLGYSYDRRKKILDGIDGTIAPGHIYGLLGVNGAGKSTFMKLMAGHLAPTEGEVLLDGTPAFERRFGPLSDLFFLPEEVTLPPLTPLRYAEVTAPFYPTFDSALFAEYCRDLGISPDLKPSAQSMGQRKKIAIAFALACRTRHLLLDEPTNGLDIPSKAILRSLLAAEADDDRTIVVSTHQVREVENLIDRVLLLHDRMLLLDASTADLSQALYCGPLTADDEALYSETSVAGRTGIAPNRTGRESRLNLEWLFIAATDRPQRITELLNTPHHE